MRRREHQKSPGGRDLGVGRGCQYLLSGCGLETGSCYQLQGISTHYEGGGVPEVNQCSVTSRPACHPSELLRAVRQYRYYLADMQVKFTDCCT